MTNITLPLWLHHIFWYSAIIHLLQINFITLSALFVLIGISIIVAGSFLAAFLWSVNMGQFDDDYTPSVRMLFDDELKAAATTTETLIKK
jgi:cbb3-type cytochrome oxidase maturation protein